MVAAAVVPDVDGLGIVPELLTRNSEHPLAWFTLYHHSLHTLLFCMLFSLYAFFLANQKWKTAGLCFLTFHSHLLGDLVGARGPDGYAWPIPYLKPFTSRWEWSWAGEWALNSWPNVMITLLLLVITVWVA